MTFEEWFKDKPMFGGVLPEGYEYYVMGYHIGRGLQAAAAKSKPASPAWFKEAPWGKGGYYWLYRRDSNCILGAVLNSFEHGYIFRHHGGDVPIKDLMGKEYWWLGPLELPEFPKEG